MSSSFLDFFFLDASWRNSNVISKVMTSLKPILTFPPDFSKFTTDQWLTVILPPIFYWIYSYIFYLCSVYNITSVELHRIPTNQKMRPPNRITVRHVLFTVLVQHFVQVLSAIALVLVDGPPDFSPGPLHIECIKVLAACFILDSYQYWMHRAMHVNKFLYRHIHSVHHQLTVLYAFGALYNHPLEGFIMDTLGTGLAAVILGLHPRTQVFFFCISTLKTVDDHCGYTLKWDPFQKFFSNNSEYHDLHHWGRGRMFNFSQPFFVHWDKWMNTDYENYLKDQAKKRGEKGPWCLPNQIPKEGEHLLVKNYDVNAPNKPFTAVLEKEE